MRFLKNFFSLCITTGPGAVAAAFGGVFGGKTAGSSFGRIGEFLVGADLSVKEWRNINQYISTSYYHPKFDYHFYK